jgi:hypothetical protein
MRPSVTGGLVALAVLTGGSALGACGSQSAPVTEGSTTIPATPNTSAPTATAPASPTPAPPPTTVPLSSPPPGRAVAPQPKVIFSLSGQGIQSTARFLMPNDWLLEWSYNCAAFGADGNFQVFEDGGADLSGVTVNEIGMGGHGTTHVYNDAGPHYLEMNGECAWTVKGIPAP